jgi:dTDP-4-amino-4,6-dideoxygalactose transaminase
MKTAASPASSPTAAGPIPLVDLKAQHVALRDEINAAIAEVFESGAFINGPLVRRFEEDFAAHRGQKRAVGCSSGTSALHMALAGLGVGAGDEVIVPAMTFMATAEAVPHAGASVVFADVDPATACLDPEALEAAITPRTASFISVDLYGRLADWGRLAPIAEKHGLAAIQDAAQSHGARPETDAQGKVLFDRGGFGALARAATFSFYPAKNLGACGDAGALTTDDADLADFAKRFADHGRSGKYEHCEIGYNYRMDAIQANILRLKLARLDVWTAARRSLAESYAEMLAGVGDLRLPDTSAGAGHVWHLFTARTARRDALLEHLRGAGIGAGIHYPIPLHLQPTFADHPQAREGAFPVSEAIARETLSLPLFPEMTAQQQERVVESVKGFFAG